ncbi:MAG: D-alanyl-D-alanine carboxypeptidase family protein, partial [Oscillospiraceae bacterium]|nr:D-alanyl-D-alanine carboxypeptidase family protein [Oscillospiraceae bacterium]
MDVNKKNNVHKNNKNVKKYILITSCSLAGVVILTFAGYGAFKIIQDFGDIKKENPVAESTTTTLLTTTVAETAPLLWWETNSFEELSTDPELNGKDDLHNGDLILVNAGWAYCGDSSDISIIYDFREGAPYSVRDRECKLRLPVIYNLNDMMTEFNAATGLNNVFVESAFRTKERQQELYDNGDPNLVAKPGFSEHETGFAFDLAL